MQNRDQVKDPQATRAASTSAPAPVFPEEGRQKTAPKPHLEQEPALQREGTGPAQRLWAQCAVTLKVL